MSRCPILAAPPPTPTGLWDWGETRRLCLLEARRWTRCPAQAEDIAQEAVVRAWRMSGACRTPELPGPWLRQIVRNEALRAQGRDQRQEEKRRLLSHEPAGEEAPDVLQCLDVRASLRTLSPEDRALVALRYGGDLTQERVANLLGLPEGTVKVRLHRLRSKLSTQLSYG